MIPPSLMVLCCIVLDSVQFFTFCGHSCCLLSLSFAMVSLPQMEKMHQWAKKCCRNSQKAETALSCKLIICVMLIMIIMIITLNIIIKIIIMITSYDIIMKMTRIIIVVQLRKKKRQLLLKSTAGSDSPAWLSDYL